MTLVEWLEFLSGVCIGAVTVNAWWLARWRRLADLRRMREESRSRQDGLLQLMRDMVEVERQRREP